MEEKQKKVERWSYPFKAKGIGTAASSEVTDPQVYYEALALAESGHYPVASNGLWHGGVHFDQNTASILDQSSVRCIADGVVVAYRIDETYKTLTYTGSGTSKEVIYSTGFVLVKHRLELPPAPAATTPPAGTPPAAEPELTFYSLYMHLMDWENYKNAGAPTPPTFMCPTQYAVSEEGATNDFSGLFVRGGAPGTPEHANKVAIIPKGCKVRVGEISSVDERWRKLVSILEGKASPALAPEIEHWVFPGEMSPTADGDVFLIGEKADDARASLLPGKGLTVRKEAKQNSAAMAVLPVDAKVELEEGSGSFRKIKSIVASTLTSPLSPECAPNIAGYIHFDSLKAAPPQEPTLNTVHILPTPVPIQAGALIGHLGKYQVASQAEAHDLLHLEVFSCDDVEAFIAESRERARQLKPEQKTLLRIPSSTKVISKEGASQTNPPLPSDPGQPTAYDMILPLAVLEALPADNKITLTTTIDGATTTEQWWKLDNLPGEDGSPISGWVKEDELITPRLHPWDWEGFDFIKETSTLDAMYACRLSADGVLDEGEKTKYQAQINMGDSGPVRERLYSIIDLNNDEKLTSAEIKMALTKPWHAQSISRLITQYESEWHSDDGLSKWKALDCYMTKEDETDWQQEKTRIRDLLWWKELVGTPGVSDTGTAHHLSAVGLLSSWLSPGRCYCHEQGIIDSPCQQGLLDITKEHFELLAGELGVEREVLRAIAVAETGDKTPFRDYVADQRHALILYERHYMRRLLLARGTPAPEVNALSEAEPKIVHTFESGYSYGTQDDQYQRLIRAREIDEDAANMSCSWGKFQVMGEYYKHLYKTPAELVEAQNRCALQHLQYFKVFLTKEKNLTTPMQNKNWLLIAQKYNGTSQVGYDQKIQDAYNELKINW